MNKDRGSAVANLFLIFSLVLLIAAIFVGGYQLNWWLKEDAVNRTAEINQDSYGRQVALVDQINNDIREVMDPDIPEAQKQAIINQICESAGFLTGKVPLSSTAETFVAKNCGL